MRRKRTGDYVPTRRYQLTLTNMASLEDHILLRCRRTNMIWLGIGAFFAIGVLWMLLVTYTPMRNILPMRLQSDLRRDYSNLSERLDTVNEELRMRQQYVDNVMSIINDKRAAAADTARQKLATPLPLDSLVEASHAERSFAKRFENAERFNVSVLSPIAAEGMTFYPPVSGIETHDHVSEQGIPYVYASPAKSSPVSAIYRGTIINTSFVTGHGITVVVQYPNDFVSVYGGLTDSFVSRGDQVVAGQRIGIAREGKYPLTFELWHNGAPLPAKDYIMF